jgi:Tol biopolymer transport system component
LSDSPKEGLVGKGISPDGKWIVYGRTDEQGKGLWKIPSDGGDAVRLNSLSVDSPAVSPDGKSIAYIYKDADAKPPSGVAIMAFEGGPPVRLFEISTNEVHWTPMVGRSSS